MAHIVISVVLLTHFGDIHLAMVIVAKRFTGFIIWLIFFFWNLRSVWLSLFWDRRSHKKKKPAVQKPAEKEPMVPKDSDSKKELKKKELPELDAVLAEFGLAEKKNGQEDSCGKLSSFFHLKLQSPPYIIAILCHIINSSHHAKQWW